MCLFLVSDLKNIKLMKLENEVIRNDLKTITENNYAKTYLDKDLSLILMEVKAPYIPIETFMALFNELSPLIKQHGIKKFIFDKRKMTTFHQPSMEWYFIEWKQKMYEYGLSVHRKILPDADWFAKCVEAGRAQILKDYPDNIIHKLDIRYCKSVAEAIEV